MPRRAACCVYCPSALSTFSALLCRGRSAGIFDTACKLSLGFDCKCILYVLINWENISRELTDWKIHHCCLCACIGSQLAACTCKSHAMCSRTWDCNAICSGYRANDVPIQGFSPPLAGLFFSIFFALAVADFCAFPPPAKLDCSLETFITAFRAVLSC